MRLYKRAACAQTLKHTYTPHTRGLFAPVQVYLDVLLAVVEELEPEVQLRADAGLCVSARESERVRGRVRESERVSERERERENERENEREKK